MPSILFKIKMMEARVGLGGGFVGCWLNAETRVVVSKNFLEFDLILMRCNLTPLI